MGAWSGIGAIVKTNEWSSRVQNEHRPLMLLTSDGRRGAARAAVAWMQRQYSSDQFSSVQFRGTEADTATLPQLQSADLCARRVSRSESCDAMPVSPAQSVSPRALHLLHASSAQLSMKHQHQTHSHQAGLRLIRTHPLARAHARSRA